MNNFKTKTSQKTHNSPFIIPYSLPFFIPFLIIKCKIKMMAIFPLLKRVSRFMFQVSRFL